MSASVENVRKTVLPNGLRILTEVMPALPSVAVGVWCNSGSSSEVTAKRGLAHFAEHMLFKGTERRSAADLSREIDAIGGYLNGWTERECACYYAKVLSRHTEKAVDLLADMVCHSVLRPQDVELERSVILEEIKAAEDAPEDWVLDLLTETLWRNHPLGTNLLGSAETVQSFSAKSVRSFLREHYRPNNLLVAAAGQLDHDRFVEWVDNSLGSLKPRANNGPTNTSKPRVRAATRLISRPTEQVYLAVGTRGYSQTVEGRIPALVLDAILGGGSSSRLFLEIREKRGLVYGIGTLCACYRQAGFFAITASATVKNIQQVASLIERELRKVKSKGINQAELRRAKEQLKGGLVISLESNATRMMSNTRAELYFGRHISLEESLAEIERTTADEVVQVAHELFDDRYLTVTAIGPFDDTPLELGMSVG